MFLVEVALGEEHHIDTDDWTLRNPPPGKDCIIAKGHTEPGTFYSFLAKLILYLLLSTSKMCAYLPSQDILPVIVSACAFCTELFTPIFQ